MYNIQAYGQMIADRFRTDSYISALRKVITPDSVVLEIGTGPGYFAIAACQFGAARVYAIEPSDAIGIAKQAAAENGFSGRIRFYQNLSTQIALPEPVDVIVSDLRGTLPLFRTHIPSIVDARTRFLKPGGILIPQEDRIWGVLLDAPDLYDKDVDLWRHTEPVVRLEAGRRVSSNTVHTNREFLASQLISSAQCWATVNYNRVIDSGIHSEMVFTANRPGTAHGFGMWFDTSLFEDVGFSLGPNGPTPVYGRAFFPFSEPVPVNAGDCVSVDLRADLINDQYVWTWNTNTPGERRFRQSTFLSAVAVSASWLTTADEYVPSLSEDGEIERFILNRMDGKSNLGNISAQLCHAFPQRFTTPERALTCVAVISKKFASQD